MGFGIQKDSIWFSQSVLVPLYYCTHNSIVKAKSLLELLTPTHESHWQVHAANKSPSNFRNYTKQLAKQLGKLTQIMRPIQTKWCGVVNITRE